MKRFQLICFLLSLQTVLIDAAQGSSAFFESTISIVGILVFTIFVGALLIYSCRIDVKHWKKSIDGRAQLEYPTASLTEFQLPPIHRAPESLVTPLEPDTTNRTDYTQLERTPEEKTLRIVTAMYTSSHRDVPEALQQSLQSKRGNPTRTQKTSTMLQTISEKDDEQEISKKSSH